MCVMDANQFCRAMTPQYAVVGGVKTYYVECGRGPTVVLLHGLSASCWNWWRTMPALAERFHVIAYDLKGSGNSAGNRSAYTAEACVAQLVGLLDHLGVKRAALVGHSMGARVALNAAITQPERVRALALISPSCYPQTAGRRVSWIILPGIGELYTTWIFTGHTPNLVRRALRWSMAPGATVSDDDVYWNMLSGADKKRAMARTYLRYGRHMQFHRPWALAQRYSEIAAPTLIISGTNDRFVPTTHPQQLAAAITGARLELWAATGHLPHAERPERFNKTVGAFLHESLRSRRPTQRIGALFQAGR